MIDIKAGLGGTKNADTLRTILESKKYKSAADYSYIRT